LRELEARYPDELVVVGVHSGKYTAERDTARIRDATVRLDALHPTINDRQFRVWRSYAVRAWPTLVAIDPSGRVIGMHAGEFTADTLVPFVEAQLARARTSGAIREGGLHLEPEPPTHLPGALSFPGKVAVDGSRIAIADSGHHLVLIGTLDTQGTRMTIDRIVGGASPAFHDGDAPAFHYPQGVAFAGDTLLVADAGNHAIRAVNVATGATRTVAGTGRQARTEQELASGALSSPWDLVVDGERAHVAMAGIHQLWTVDLSTGRAAPFSGSGAEELHDGPHDEAALAQPMGLCSMGDALYFVDAESSAVRRADRDGGGGVRTIVGTGLFDFGDEDGTGDEVRLQHPQGIAAAPDGRLLICDSYNDALKWIDPAARRADTWVRGFHEPSGLAFGDAMVYVADTNAHRIAVVSVRSGEVTTLSLEG
jgi:DNA-binding beta-propeller fold protein YncE